MHDGVALEGLGLPAAVVVTSEFTREAAVQRQALGMPDLLPVVIEHPLSTLTESEIDARADAAVAAAIDAWRGANA